MHQSLFLGERYGSCGFSTEEGEALNRCFHRFGSQSVSRRWGRPGKFTSSCVRYNCGSMSCRRHVLVKLARIAAVRPRARCRRTKNFFGYGNLSISAKIARYPYSHSANSRPCLYKQTRFAAAKAERDKDELDIVESLRPKENRPSFHMPWSTLPFVGGNHPFRAVVAARTAGFGAGRASLSLCLWSRPH